MLAGNVIKHLLGGKLFDSMGHIRFASIKNFLRRNVISGHIPRNLSKNTFLVEMEIISHGLKIYP